MLEKFLVVRLLPRTRSHPTFPVIILALRPEGDDGEARWPRGSTRDFRGTPTIVDGTTEKEAKFAEKPLKSHPSSPRARAESTSPRCFSPRIQKLPRGGQTSPPRYNSTPGDALIFDEVKTRRSAFEPDTETRESHRKILVRHVA